MDKPMMSVESLVKWLVLQNLLPVLGRSMALAKSVLFVDAFAGRGKFDDDKLGTFYGSPVLLWNALKGMPNAQRTLALIDRDVEEYKQLCELFEQLKTHDAGVNIIPTLADCETALQQLVEGWDASKTFIFLDDFGTGMPESIVELSQKPSVTLLMRFSEVALKRGRSSKMQDLVSQMDVPYWCYEEGMQGQHQFKLLLCTHDKTIFEVCQPIMKPIDDPRTVIYSPDTRAVPQVEPVAPVLVKGSKRQRSNHQRLRAIELHKEGHTAKEIAAHLRCHRNSVYRYLQHAKKSAAADTMVKRSVKGRRRHYDAPMAAKAGRMRKMRAAGHSYREIAEAVGCSIDTVARYVRTA